MSKWRKWKLERLIHIKHGYGFKSQYFTDSGPHILLTPGNFYDEGGFKPGTREKYYKGPIPDGFILERGDLIVAMTEQAEGLLGSTAIVPEGNLYLHNQRLGLISILDETELDKQYLYRLFNTPIVRQQIRGSANGAKVRHTSPSRIYEVKVNLPPPATQKKIAAILSAYDELIENNRRRIALLERMAEEIYREWFVRMRFPGHEQVKVHKGVPEGWEVIKLGAICKVKGGKRLPLGHELTDSVTPHPYIKGRDIRNGKINISELQYVENNTYDHIRNYTVNVNDICVTIVANIGDVGLIPPNLDGANLTENAVKLTAHTDKVTPTFLCHVLSTRFYKEYMEILAAGAAQSKLGIYKIKSIDILLPPQNIQKRFSKIVISTTTQIETLAITNSLLSQTRDLLLSRLIAGKLAVDDLDIHFLPGMAPDGTVDVA